MTSLSLLTFFLMEIGFVATGTVVFVKSMESLKRLEERFKGDEDAEAQLASLNTALFLLYMFLFLGIAMIGGRLILF